MENNSGIKSSWLRKKRKRGGMLYQICCSVTCCTVLQCTAYHYTGW